MTHEEMVVKVVTIICLSVILVAAVICIAVVSVMTDRDMTKAETFSFGGLVIVAAIGGFTWASIHRRRKWHLHLQQNGAEGDSRLEHTD